MPLLLLFVFSTVRSPLSITYPRTVYVALFQNKVCAVSFSYVFLQGYTGLDGAKGELGAAGAKV